MFNLVDKNNLVLPDFQRNFVWNKAGQRALAASVLLNLPIGSFLILEGNKNDFATKKIGFSTKEALPTDECKFLLDGQQRLTSLRSMFGDFFSDEDWKNTAREIYANLKTRWFLRIVPKKGEEDIFGWTELIFSEEHLKNIEPSQLESIIVDKPINVTKTNYWWNPDFIFKDTNNNISRGCGKKHTLMVSREMVKESLIPLSIYDKESKLLLKYGLDLIASERAKELKIELEGNEDKVLELIEKADINTIYENVAEGDNLENILRELQSKWTISVRYYLENILKKTEAQIISLKSDEIGRAVIIFERINKGGTNLDNFDLVVARAARDSSVDSLTKRIISYLKEEIDLPESLTTYLNNDTKPNKLNISYMDTVKNSEIHTIIKKQYLNLLSIFANVQYGEVDEIKLEQTKKDKILNISYQDINSLTEKVMKSIVRACAFLQIRCGLVKISDLHYNLMILPIAYLLSDDNIWSDKEKLDKIEYWYWGSIFAGEYRLYPNQKCIDDIQDLYKWIVNGEEIRRYTEFENKVLNVEEFSDKNILTRRDSENDIPPAIHKCLLQYELSRQPRDLYYNNVVLSSWKIAREEDIVIDNKNIKMAIQDHHIIPLGTCTTLQESTKNIRENKNHILNSILNRTYILKESNNIFSAKEPLKYLKILDEKNVNHMLNTHFINDNYSEYLNSEGINDNDKILNFYDNRYEKIKTILLDELNRLKN